MSSFKYWFAAVEASRKSKNGYQPSKPLPEGAKPMGKPAYRPKSKFPLSVSIDEDGELHFFLAKGGWA